MEPSAKTTPGDVFRHLLAIVALYISAVSFGTLLFGYVDRWFPDPLTDPFAHPSGAIRWAIASLIIVFPVYVFFSWAIAHDVSRHPEKRALKSRKWLYHFTVFAASAIIIGDLVALIYNFLSGELSTRFILKVVSVLFIAVAVFAYYVWNIRRETMASADPRMRWFVWGVVTIVAAAAIGGFFLVGSPFRARLARFDERRVGDLQTLQWQIINYWQRKETLPPSLDSLRDDISGFVPPRDSETGAGYEYRIIGPLAFELCATFKTKSAAADGRYAPPRPVIADGHTFESWAHGEGRTCFTRTIDPDLYGIEKPVRQR